MSETNELIETLTVEEVAKILRVNERTVYRRCDDNEIPHFRVGDNHNAIRFLKSKFMQWIEEQHKA